MKLFYALAILLLAVALPQARAQQTPDDQYIAIYGQIQQADSLQGAGQPRQALEEFAEAQAQLQKFQKIYPDWNQKIISYRLKYVAEKIAGLTMQLPPPPTNAPPQMESPATNANSSTPATDIESQLGGLRAQVQGLQSDNATLQAKLKEALAAQPSAVDSGELSKAQAQVRSLMKENDLLKAGQSQTPAVTTATNVVETSVPNSEPANPQAQPAPPVQPVATETQPAPSAPETQALPKSPEPQPAANPDVAKKSVNEMPAGSAGLVAEAQKYFAARQYDMAEADYQKILQQDQNNAPALGNLAAIELEEGKLGLAETHIKAALAQSPNDAYDLSILGYLKFRQQKFDDALDALSRAEKLDPKNAEIENYLGVTLSRKGQHAQAEAALRRAIEIDPNYAAAHNNLAVVYISQQQPSVELARLEYQKAVELGQPHNPDLEKILAARGAPISPR